MCGRYLIEYEISEVKKRFNLGSLLSDFDSFQKSYNMAPSQLLPVIVFGESGTGRRGELMKWGFIPFWAKDEAVAFKTINARVEGLADKPTYRDSYRKRRCLVPASGFFEWRKIAGKKVPFCVRPTGDKFWAFAGLWSEWKRPKGGELVETFTIITRDAPDTVRDLHERAPLNLPEANWDAWLNPKTNMADIQLLIGSVERLPYSVSMLEVSTRLNSPVNNDPGVLQVDRVTAV